jgi:hypothetical protein
MAMNNHTTIEELLEAVFSVQSMLRLFKGGFSVIHRRAVLPQ